MSKQREKRESILADCLDEILDGRSTLADCLDRFPDHREFLGEMLPAGLMLARMPGLEPSTAFRREARIRLLAAIKRAHEVRPAARNERRMRIFRPGIPAGLRMLPSLLVVLVLLPVLLCAGGATVVSAAERSVPGDPLYGLDLAMESVQYLLTWDAAGRAQLSLELAAERIGELEELAAKGGSPENFQEAMDGYQHAIQQTEDALSHTESPEARRRIESDATAEISRDMEVLSSLRGRLPEKANSALDKVIEKTVQNEKKLEVGDFGPPIKEEEKEKPNKPEKTKTPGKEKEKDTGKPDK
jgi:hypothetical protein